MERSVEELVVTSERPAVLSVAGLVSPARLVRVDAGFQEETVVWNEVCIVLETVTSLVVKEVPVVVSCASEEGEAVNWNSGVEVVVSTVVSAVLEVS
jgi:hypothetical protein